MDTYIYLLITMAFSAFFSGMEIAFVSVDKLRFEMERKEGLTSRILSYFFRNSNNFISTMLVGNNIALVIYGILMAQVIKVHLLGDLISNDFVEVLLQTVISTLIILVTGEFLPKTLFKINPNLVLKVCAFPLLICYIVLYPVSQLASGLSYLFLRLFGMKINKEASDKAFGKVDLDYFVQSSIDNAEDEEELDAEVKIFQNALDFSSIKIRDCIVPRTEIVAVDLTATLEDLKSLFVESGISKIIVYDGNIDNVVGYIHSSEMFRNPADWRNNVKEVPIVPETMAAHKLMKLFMQQKKTIELQTKEAQLSTQQSLLIDQEAELKDKEELLAATTLALQQQQEELDQNRTALTSAQDSLALQQSKIEEQAALLAAQQAQIDKLVGLRSQIIEDLRDNLSDVGQRVTVDRKTGAVTFESSVLFDTGRNEIKEAGKAALNSCIPVYIHTLLSEEYRDYVGEIIVEGHTDTTGQYLNNLALSQQRALAVATYCLSDEMVGLSYTDKETFKSIMTANGRADADPIYNADGTVNMDASRRVVIKFRMKDSDMIDQMSAILEGSAQGD